MKSLKTVFVLGLLSLALPSTAHPWDDKPLPKHATGRPRTPKYFNEAGGSLELGHYDDRFFHDKVPYEEHRLVLHDLIRSYLIACEEYGIETWLAHGTLLGWWWNGQVMPWDYDLDVQVSNNTLYMLGDTLNRTEHVFNRTANASDSPEDAGTYTEHAAVTYLLDVNPHHVDLTRGDMSNIIDARWIDTSNGMFIDITGVRERDPLRPGVWSCKNKHRFTTQDLWPLRVSEFEGVRAKMPNNFVKILSEEYGEDSILNEDYAQWVAYSERCRVKYTDRSFSHHWDEDIKEWVVKSPEAAKQRKIETA